MSDIVENDIVINVHNGELGIVVGMSWDHMEVGGWLRVKSASGLREKPTEDFEVVEFLS